MACQNAAASAKRFLGILVVMLLSDGAVTRLVAASAANPAACVAADAALAFVKASPVVVGAQQKDKWLAMFAENGLIQDPFGAIHQQGRQQQSDFWDTFISGINITFAPHYDIVTCTSVVRIVNISAITPNGCPTNMRTIIVYDLIPPPAEAHAKLPSAAKLQLASLTALWSLQERSAQLFRHTCAWKATAQMSIRMLKFLGPTGAGRYASGFFSIGKEGQSAAAAALADLAGEDGVRAFSRHFSESGSLTLHQPGSARTFVSPTAIVAGLGDWGCKLVAPPNSTVPTARRVSAEVGFACGSSKHAPGLAVIDFAADSLSLVAAAFYVGTPTGPVLSPKREQAVI
ncbi:TMCO4 [Symbiodinium natans]|uniref:TMCO4 protein n=1 Tax=Symbiodinium natans TaxID=878477 RepID=A0A812RVN0_9DINO|nr:TMCO4 [Symbiodinium natans]